MNTKIQIAVVSILFAGAHGELLLSQPPQGGGGPSRSGSASTLEAYLAKLKVLDVNLDGVIAKAEVGDKRLLPLIERADTDHDGLITQTELEALYKKESSATTDNGRSGPPDRNGPPDRSGPPDRGGPRSDETGPGRPRPDRPPTDRPPTDESRRPRPENSETDRDQTTAPTRTRTNEQADANFANIAMNVPGIKPEQTALIFEHLHIARIDREQLSSKNSLTASIPRAAERIRDNLRQRIEAELNDDQKRALRTEWARGSNDPGAANGGPITTLREQLALVDLSNDQKFSVQTLVLQLRDDIGSVAHGNSESSPGSSIRDITEKYKSKITELLTETQKEKLRELQSSQRSTGGRDRSPPPPR